MIVTLHTQGLQTLVQVRAFVEGNEPISFTLADRHAAYGWMADTLRHFGYAHCKRAGRGVLRQFLSKVTGLSRTPVARCMGMPASSGWRVFPTDICTTCGNTRPIRACAGRSTRPARPRSLYDETGGERRKSAADGCCGYLRVDSVHQV